MPDPKHPSLVQGLTSTLLNELGRELANTASGSNTACHGLPGDRHNGETPKNIDARRPSVIIDQNILRGPEEPRSTMKIVRRGRSPASWLRTRQTLTASALLLAGELRTDGHLRMSCRRSVSNDRQSHGQWRHYCHCCRHCCRCCRHYRYPGRLRQDRRRTAGRARG